MLVDKGIVVWSYIFFRYSKDILLLLDIVINVCVFRFSLFVFDIYIIKFVDSDNNLCYF